MPSSTSSMDSSEPPELLLTLLGINARPMSWPAASLERVASELAAIRSTGPVVDWFGVNDRRVDAMVSAGDDQYRIVRFTSDGRSLDDVSVFRRPPRFDGVAGGRVVVLNGPSGSGKSSVLAAVVSHSSLPWAMFDEPVMGHVDQGFLIWRDRAPTLHRGFLEAIAALARCANLVGVAAAGHPAALVDAAFEGVEVLRIGLDCDVATLLEREHGREGRWGGLVAESLADHHGWTYDLRFDTTRLSPAAIAGEVLRHLGIDGCSPTAD